MIKWLNKNNRPFYNNAKPRDFLINAKKRGLDQEEDFNAIRIKVHPYLERPQAHALEIGMGEGRVLRWMAKNYPNVQVLGIDSCPAFVDYNKNRFSDFPQITLVKEDVLSFQSTQSFDVALWMWSGFAEFNPKEQKIALMQIFKSLKSSSIMVIDLPWQTMGKYVKGQFVIIEEQFGTLSVYISSDSELKGMATKIGFSRIEECIYRTSKDTERVSYTLFK